MQLLKLLMVLSLMLAVSPVARADSDETGAAVFAKQCAACHTTGGPPRTVEDALTRTAPDLSYAGVKFKADWLVNWLQSPTLLRPAGLRAIDAVKSTDAGDMVDIAKVPGCQSKLTPAQAAAVTAHLQTLTGTGQSIDPVAKGKKVRTAKAYRTFATKYACIACHRVLFRGEPRGGLSGPDLTTAGLRLNADWTASMIANPKNWRPISATPKYQIDAKDVRLLTLYLMKQTGAK